MKMSSVVHFEMPAKDKKRVSEFYTKVFGWQMQLMDEKMGNYLLANTTPTDHKTMRPAEPGAINGGFFDFEDNELNRAPHVVISVANLDQSIKAVQDAGGEILGEKMDIPNVGMYVSIKDTEGNLVGMLQSSER